jgi:hypothetical protein
MTLPCPQVTSGAKEGLGMRAGTVRMDRSMHVLVVEHCYDRETRENKMAVRWSMTVPLTLLSYE